MGTEMQPNTTPTGTNAMFETLDFVAAARTPAEIAAVIHRYLGSWSRERIDRVRAIAIDGAPFGPQGRPCALQGAPDLRRIRDAVHRRCVALRQTGAALPPDLVELDEMFFIAAQMAESVDAPAYQARSPAVAARSGLFAFV